MITQTLKGLKESRHIAALLKQILIKFNSSSSHSGNAPEKETGSTLQVQHAPTIALWLKSLIAIHWTSIVKCDAKDLESLAQIQAFIEKKSRMLEKYLVLKGKIEMINLVSSAKKGSTMKSGGKGKGKAGVGNGPLVYKDGAENDDEDDEDMDSEGDVDDDEDDEDDFDEEITGAQTRKRVKGKGKESSDEEESKDGDKVDDSVSDDQDDLEDDDDGDVEMQIASDEDEDDDDDSDINK